MEKRLHRSLTDRKIAGVCGGIAEYLGWDTTLVRLLWVILTLLGGSGIQNRTALGPSPRADRRLRRCRATLPGDAPHAFSRLRRHLAR